MSRRYLVRTYGCQMNEHDSERIAGLLEADGLVRADSEDDADVVVLNTCCIRENADNKLYGNLGHLKTWKGDKDGRQIVVSGCLAQKDQERVAERAGHVDVVMGTHNVHRAAELLREAEQADLPITEILTEAVIDDHAMFPSALPARRETSYNAWVTIQIGCDNNCAFCIVPAVRGVEMSRPFDQVVDEVRALAEQGVTEVTLLGQNVNSYGRDLQLASRQAGDESARLRPLFADLLREVGAVEGIRRVRFTSPHPKDMRPDTFAAMADVAAVCEHLHYPLQSGSDRILAKMHRGYTAERYLTRLAEARGAIADLAVSTDIIVGFPGETEADFQHTMEVAAAAEYDYAYMFIFSPRGHGGRHDAGRLRRPGGCGGALPTPAHRRRARGTRPARGPRRPGRGSPRRGPEQARSVGHEWAHAPEQARPLHATHAAAHRQLRLGRDHARRSAPSPRELRRTPRRAHPSPPHSRRRPLTPPDPPVAMSEGSTPRSAGSSEGPVGALR